MESTEEHSRVPARLRSFHHPPFLTSESVKTKPSQEVQSQISTSPELCPPHWRRPRRRSLKSTLKSIICKDWQTLLEQSPSQPTVLAVRPPMRMKDSDDYLTARGANPRTGLISPSVGSRTPCTPDSPGDALKLHAYEHNSPTPHPKTRSSLSRANQGRKISGGNTGTKRTDINGMPWNTPQTVTSGHEVEYDHVRRSSPALTEDSFVVHMPSAREPQPFAYPGWTAEQIEALEHYQRKTRRVSNEDYDRRLLQNFGQPPTTLGAAEWDNIPTEENGPTIYTCPTGQHFIACRYQDSPHEPLHSDEPPRIHVHKRKARVDEIRQELDTSPCMDEAEAKKLLASPLTSSPTKIINPIDREATQPLRYHEIPRTVPTAEAHANPSSSPFSISASKHAQIYSATGEISGKSIFGSAPSCTAVANAATAACSGDQYHADGFTKMPSQPIETSRDGNAPAMREYDLCSQLPRVRLVRPEFAGAPRGREQHEGARQCSFGCRKAGNTGECAERRQLSSASTILRADNTTRRQVSTSFVDHPPQQARASSNDIAAWALIIISTIVRMSVDYARSVREQLPHWRAVVVEMLSASPESDAPAKEKLEAFRALVSLLGHALAVCTALAMMWKLGVAVLNVLEVLLWPLAVPLRIVRFMVGLG